MNQEQTTAFIINELTRQRDRNDIVLALCRQLNIEWKAAEQLVRDVESQHGRTVAKRQSPFMMLLGAAIILVGIVLTINGVLFFNDLLQMQTYDQILSGTSVYYIGGSLLTGIGMIVGGIIGFWKIFAGFLS
jgi:hypothetical protein